MRIFLAWLASAAVLVACAGEPAEEPRDHPSSSVTFGGPDAKLAVKIADDIEERRRGLMDVEELPADQGMAFVWPEPERGTFWMKNTLIPLSIAFVDDAGRVIDILDMEPCEADPCPRYGIHAPYVLAVEANLGWFDEHGVQAGDRADLRTNLDG
jgi:uncharacterized membrane protein (UPF0127 family)